MTSLFPPSLYCILLCLFLPGLCLTSSLNMFILVFLMSLSLPLVSCASPLSHLRSCLLFHSNVQRGDDALSPNPFIPRITKVWLDIRVEGARGEEEEEEEGWDGAESPSKKYHNIFTRSHNDRPGHHSTACTVDYVRLDYDMLSWTVSIKSIFHNKTLPLIFWLFIRSFLKEKHETLLQILSISQISLT